MSEINININYNRMTNQSSVHCIIYNCRVFHCFHPNIMRVSRECLVGLGNELVIHRTNRSVDLHAFGLVVMLRPGRDGVQHAFTLLGAFVALDDVLVGAGVDDFE